jgi:hypothetical protein
MSEELHLRVYLAVLALMAILPTAATGAGTIYVDADVEVLGNGFSWNSAHKYLRDALTNAWGGCEIRVAQGTYKPDEAESLWVKAGDREATFQLKNRVTVKGGYAGVGGT